MEKRERGEKMEKREREDGKERERWKRDQIGILSLFSSPLLPFTSSPFSPEQVFGKEGLPETTPQVKKLLLPVHCLFLLPILLFLLLEKGKEENWTVECHLHNTTLRG